MTESIASQLPSSPIMHEVARQIYPASALYVLATPIGNLGDISLRALHVLELCDAVACEDTRNTAQLMTRYGLHKPLVAAHQHNEREVAQKIVARLAGGERIALVSDAGTPAVSDPGARIVDAVLAAGLRVIPIPGASAVVTALSASGLTSDQFHFHGFLPAKAKQRETVLAGLRGLPATLVFYEAPHRIVETVDALAALLEPERRLVFGRELTKLFEQVHRCPLGEAAAWLAADVNRQRGEFVLLVEGATRDDGADAGMADARRILGILLAECSVSQAASLAAQITGVKKNALYDIALKMKASHD
jgi:16S rRNA (cytidine1402-2'-O)-methyltransferase